MHVFSTVLTAFAASSALFDLCTAASYALEDDYSTDFFDQFDFFTGSDPTHGFVNYVDRSTAQGGGMISTSNGVYIGVDSTNIASSGRRSVRITSKKSYNGGLIVLDLAHMPGSVCGTWPAFWMVGPNWPNDGEIDIIEGVNDNRVNAMTLHTSAGCSITDNGKFSGEIQTANCDVNAAGQSANAGCSIANDQATSYGDGFNAAGGGVYATEWANDHIGIWHFARANIPADITAGTPDPSNWGPPAAMFQGSCNISDTFKDLQIVFDNTFCGDWAGAVFGESSCGAKAATCSEFVANNPSAFIDSFWQVNSLKVYQPGAVTGKASFRAAASSSKVKSQTAVFPQTSTAVGSEIAPTRTRHFHSHGPHPTQFGGVKPLDSTLDAASSGVAASSVALSSSQDPTPTESESASDPEESDSACVEDPSSPTDTSDDPSISSAPSSVGSAPSGVVIDAELVFSTAWPQRLKRRDCATTTQLSTAPSTTANIEPAFTGVANASSPDAAASTVASTEPVPTGDSELKFTAAWRRGEVQKRDSTQVAVRDSLAARRAQHLHKHRMRHANGRF